MAILDANLLLGLVVGVILAALFSYLLNVLTRKNSLALISHACLDCGVPFKKSAAIPLFGHFLEEGKCKGCSKKKSLSMPFFELLIITFSVWSFGKFSFSGALGISVLFFALLGISVMDIRKWIIPNTFVLVILLISVGANISGLINFNNSLLGLAVASGVSLILVIPQFLSKSEAGYAFGDVKLILAVSMYLGWILSIYVFFLASVLAFVTWFILGVTKSFRSGRPLQFGPFVAFASMVLGIGRLVDPQFITHLLTFRF